MRHKEDSEGQVGDQNGWEKDQGAIVKGGSFQFDRVFHDCPETYVVDCGGVASDGTAIVVERTRLSDAKCGVYCGYDYNYIIVVTFKITLW